MKIASGLAYIVTETELEVGAVLNRPLAADKIRAIRRRASKYLKPIKGRPSPKDLESDKHLLETLRLCNRGF